MSSESTITDFNDSVFLTALPYGMTALSCTVLGFCGLGRSVAWAANPYAFYIVNISKLALGILGATSFITTAHTAINSKNSADFKREIGSALSTAAYISAGSTVTIVALAALSGCAALYFLFTYCMVH